MKQMCNWMLCLGIFSQGMSDFVCIDMQILIVELPKREMSIFVFAFWQKNSFVYYTAATS
jgi:hypothetical protein